MYQLFDAIGSLKYVGLERGSILAQNGIATIKDLLNYFPKRYKDTSEIISLKQVIEDFSHIDLVNQATKKYTCKVTIEEQKFFYTRSRRPILEVKISDGTTDAPVYAVWFNQPFLKSSLEVGKEVLIHGKPIVNGKKLVFQSPSQEVVTEGKKPIHLGRITPIYSAIKKITTPYMRRFEAELMATVEPIRDFIPESILEDRHLIDIGKAYTLVHDPQKMEDIEVAQERLAIQEILEIRDYFAKESEGKKTTASVTFLGAAINKELKEYIHNLPFSLTNDQQKAIERMLELFHNEATTQDIFLYGDVGSGKTVVTAIMAALFLAQDASVLFMAPTTILAEQHYATISKLFEMWGIPTTQLDLVTSASKAKIKGRSKLVIGTHALLFRDMELGNVGFVIIDEQHRFGVNQRFALKEKFSVKSKMPHILSLSATPIPRTLAQVFYGFTETIYLKEKPHKTNNIQTKYVPSSKLDDLYLWLFKQVKEHNQKIFLVFPIIDESPQMEAAALTQVYEALQNNFFKDIKLGIVHGRMKDKDKNEVLEQFRNGEISILFATAVIEVGIDVPDASIIVIHDANRFGLAQLHQLRGRVGRNGAESYCFVTDHQDDRTERIEYFCKHSEGLELATFDLSHRGAGNIYGVEQAGVPDMRIADLANYELLHKAIEVYDILQAHHISIPRYVRSDEQIAKP